MKLERLEDNNQYQEIVFKADIDDKTLLIHITKEGWEDNLDSKIDSNNREKLIRAIKNKLLNQSFEFRGTSSYKIILIKSNDLN